MSTELSTRAAAPLSPLSPVSRTCPLPHARLTGAAHAGVVALSRLH